MIAKTLQLISLIPSSPAEFFDHASAIVSSRWERWRSKRVAYRTTSLQEVVRTLSSDLGSTFAECLLEPSLTQVEYVVRQGQASLLQDGPFATFHNGDSALARLCYATTRALKPRLVLETGVCYGVTSAYILQALATNQVGNLHSVDLPPLGKDGDKHIGWLIPPELRGRWTLHRGVSERVLSPLLARLGSIDLFIHDSLHTYRNMRREFEAAWPHLRPGGVLISDDVEGNAAFLELAKRSDIANFAVVQEQGKDALLGIAVKHA
jgi:hypothetical protein